jgi:hypothetical protein
MKGIALGGLVLLVVATFLLTRRPSPTPVSIAGGYLLLVSRAWRRASLIATLGSALIGAGLSTTRADRAGTLGIFMLIVAILLVGTIYLHAYRVRADRDGITVRSFSSSRVARWDDIVGIQLNPRRWAIVIGCRHQRPLSVSMLVEGLEGLDKAIQQYGRADLKGSFRDPGV